MLLTLTNIYYNRLKITLVNTGLTFTEDIRDAKKWYKALYSKRENAIIEELPDTYTIDKMKKIMTDADISPHEQRKLIYEISGKLV